MHSGGGQEKGRRAGTSNTPGIVGMGAACDLAASDLDREEPRLRALTRKLFDGVGARIDGVTLNGHPTQRLPNNLNLSFGHVEAEGLIAALRSVAVSSGSACASDLREPSYVMKALGATDERAHAAVRFGVGRITTEADVWTTLFCMVSPCSGCGWHRTPTARGRAPPAGSSTRASMTPAGPGMLAGSGAGGLKSRCTPPP